MRRLLKKQRNVYKSVFPSLYHLLLVKVKKRKENYSRCNYQFVYIASDRCQQEKRKTINGEDILWAMQSLGFENYTEALKIYLAKYREVNILKYALFIANDFG